MRVKIVLCIADVDLYNMSGQHVRLTLRRALSARQSARSNKAMIRQKNFTLLKYVADVAYLYSSTAPGRAKTSEENRIARRCISISLDVRMQPYSASSAMTEETCFCTL